ncbi:SIR2 family protein [Croceicoccus sp. Ery15]|uniref:SIR2 family protein n=1 Tax=Croceicoccus sp. Ery15 TaxID=1703338 RepID=UPI001E58C09B|nr:SIR2 family protein [Croceicoccus sp. Ery15]
MIDELCHRAGGRVALLIGNGIHLYPNGGQSWNALVERLARTNGFASPEKAKNLAMPEFYDLIDLGRPAENGSKSASQAYPLKRQFCDGMEGWQPSAHHQGIVEWAIRHGSPILTTNFDLTFAKAAQAESHSLFRPRGSRKRASDYYPWEKYFARVPLDQPCDGFGVWHINGFISHIRSIRLGLSDYMGCVTRSRPWILDAREFPHWAAEDTWLDILFKMPLVVFGVGLEGQEVWLRWLLIQRANLYKKRGGARPPAWYVYPVGEDDERQREKRFFLECLGVEPFEVTDYPAIYDPQHWAG